MDSQLTAVWHADHARFEMLLNILEKQVAAFHEEGQPNYQLMLDIIDYLHRYPDRFHHPRENVAFSRMLIRNPDWGPIMNRLLQEHRVIAAAGEDFLEMLQAALNGSMIERKAIETAAATYLVYYRHHIKWEEASVIPDAARFLREDDWNAVAEAVPKEADRLFGEELDVRYRDLRHEMQQLANR